MHAMSGLIRDSSAQPLNCIYGLWCPLNYRGLDRSELIHYAGDFSLPGTGVCALSLGTSMFCIFGLPLAQTRYHQEDDCRSNNSKHHFAEVTTNMHRKPIKASVKVSLE